MRTVHSETGCERQRLARQQGDAACRSTALSVGLRGWSGATPFNEGNVWVNKHFQASVLQHGRQERGEAEKPRNDAVMKDL